MDARGFLDLALANEVNRAIVERLPRLDLPDAWLVSGSLFQTVWNMQTGRAPGYGIKDYDVFYFDTDTSWDAEDDVIRRCADLFADLGAEVEIRNQARVHLWFERRFGQPYPPLRSVDDGLTRYASRCHAVAVRLEPDGRIDIAAPFGLEDIFQMRIRPNRSQPRRRRPC